jgi:5-methyltetrahydrofolate--homocysteine methyltransferase
MEELPSIYQAIIEGDAANAKARVEAALGAGVAPETILKDGLIAAMAEVGRLFEAGEYFVPEMLIAARAMQTALGLIKPSLAASGAKAAGRVAVGTVKGDLHDIGKNLVAMMLEGAGFEIMDLGTDVAPEKFVAAAQAGRVDILALSALLTTTMPNMKATLDALTTAGLRDKVKVMIGGAPVTEAYAKQIGADGYSPDASSAARTARTLVA